MKLREDLGTLRQQATTFTLDDTTKSQLEEMKTGSREIAQQLSEPGQPYHDGIYTATKGAQDLNAGLGKATTDLETALKSVDDLSTGSARIDTMAKNTQAKIGEIQRALPTAQSHTDTNTRTLAPMYAVLIAAGVLFGATIRGSGRIHTKTIRLRRRFHLLQRVDAAMAGHRRTRARAQTRQKPQLSRQPRMAGKTRFALPSIIPSQRR